MLKILEVGDSLIPGKYKIHSEFSKVINYIKIDGKDMLSIVQPSVGGGPTSILVSNLENFPEKITLKGDLLCLEDLNIDLNTIKRYRSELDISYHNLSRNRLDLFRDLLINHQEKTYLLDGQLDEGNTVENCFRKQFSEGKKLLFERDLVKGIEAIRGLGIGLTPAGDDFLAGVMIGVHLYALMTRQNDFKRDKIIKVILKNATGNNDFSNELLKMSSKGRLNQKMKRFIFALYDSSMDELKESFMDQIEIGHSSGIDQLVGLYEVLSREYPWQTLLNQ